MKLKTSLIGVSISFALISLLVSCGDKPQVTSPPKEPDPIPIPTPVVSVVTPTAPLWYGGDTILMYSVSPGTNTEINGVLQNKTSGSFIISGMTENTSFLFKGFNGPVATTKTVEVKVYGKDTTDLCKKDGWWKLIRSEYLDTTSHNWLLAPLPSAKTTKFFPDGTCYIDTETPPIPISYGNKWGFITVNGKLAIQWPVQSNGQYYFVDKLVTGPVKDTIVTSYTISNQLWRQTYVK